MRAELDALCAAVTTATGRDVHLIEPSSDCGTRYYLVAPSGFTRGDDVPLSGPGSVVDGPVRVKAISSTPAGAMVDLAAARDALVPDGASGALTVTGRGVTVQFLRHEVDIVEDLVLADTNVRLATSVDSYRLVSVPDVETP